MRHMSAKQVLDHLRKECDKSGGQGKWAEAHGISAAYLSDVINGRRDLGSKVLKALGLVAHTTYRKVADE